MFVLTGANGPLFGRPVLDHLRHLVSTDQIIAGTHRPEEANELKEFDVAVCRVDFDEPATLAAAFRGATAVLINGTNYGTSAERRGAQHAAAIRAAVDAGVERIVYLSWPDPNRYLLPMFSDFAESEALLRRLAPEATILRTTYGLAQTVGRDVREAAALGILAAPAAQARTAPAHIDDLAEATARVLINDQHRGRLYTLTARDSIDWTDLARLASTVSGQPTAYKPISDDQFTTKSQDQGIPAPMIEILLGVYRSFRAGWTSGPTEHLATILGRAPEAAIDAVAAAVGE
jgi:NAD(P)H dehydrogenase (quinone)